MWQLVAQGPQPQQRWRQALEPGRDYVLGRSTAADLSAPWESSLSRRHAAVRAETDSVLVTRLTGAANPLFVAGGQVDSARLQSDGYFVVGETQFTVARAEAATPSPLADQPFDEITFSRQELHRIQYRDADHRLEVLSHLPEVIGGAHDEQELMSRLTHLLLTGVRHAEAAAVVEVRPHGELALRHWERRRETSGVFHPSRKLALDALQQQRSVLHIWERRTERRDDYTVSGEFDWSYCTPVLDHPPRWGLYVAGRLDRTQSVLDTMRPDGLHLQADVKFTELLADVIGSVSQVNRLESSLSVLRQFLSPPVLAALERSSPDGGLNTSLLEPKECCVTVMFCDVRGFSQHAEESAGDLRGLLDRISGALDLMTREILEHGGVTGEFLGDAVLGFWGWPFASEESSLNACRAALAIRRALSAAHSNPSHPLADFEVGIGIAQGRAVAGKLGSAGRTTVTVFGPVVNLASRLETMTKQLRAPILLDEAVAAVVARRLATSEGRTRKLARVLPYGMETPLVVSELLPPLAEHAELTDEHLRTYQEGVEAFMAGEWEQAYRKLHSMPASDRAPDFLLPRISQHNRAAPPGWTGVIELPGK